MRNCNGNSEAMKNAVRGTLAELKPARHPEFRFAAYVNANGFYNQLKPNYVGFAVACKLGFRMAGNIGFFWGPVLFAASRRAESLSDDDVVRICQLCDDLVG